MTGPHPADTLFHAAARATYDAAVCMYHDQALIPFKTVAFEDGVNVTLGLPFVRTSPDHGTAFGIAAEGCASAQSFIESLKLAAAIAAARAAARPHERRGWPSAPAPAPTGSRPCATSSARWGSGPRRAWARTSSSIST